MEAVADVFFAKVLAFLTSWQFRTILGVVAIDVVLGYAAALRTSSFDFGKLAQYYKTMIIPYVLGYGIFFVVIQFVIPADMLGGLGDPISTGTLWVAWGTLIGTLLKSIKDNFQILYRPGPADHK